jgi:hypothetical protein
MTKTVISESHDPRFQMLGASRYYIQGCAGDEYCLCQNHDGCSCNFSLDAFSTDESSQAYYDCRGTASYARVPIPGSMGFLLCPSPRSERE